MPPIAGIKRSRLGLFQLKVVGDPSPEAWSRVHRYASWMHQLRRDGRCVLGGDTLRKLCLNSPAGGWFPALKDLSWSIAECNIQHIDLFFSPHLESISIDPSYSWINSEVPQSVPPILASAISTLPAPSLQSLLVDICHPDIHLGYFKVSLSSIILRCGPPLSQFASTIPLLDAAVNHLIHLPHLRILRIEGPPPSYSTSSLPLVFPPLVEFTLVDGTARGWLSLLERLEHSVPATQSATPLSKTKESLESLIIGSSLGPVIIDISLVSVIQIFRNLVCLTIEAYCDNEDDEGKCAFEFDDDDITKLAMALPRLRALILGSPCSENTCATTAACLLQISVHCIELEKLEIHFNTTNIVDDLKNISEDPRFQELRSLPRCTLWCLDVDQIPLDLDEPAGPEAVAKGMVDIFPSLVHCSGFDEVWDTISGGIARLRGG